MNVKKAKYSGFCFGVNRAVDSALKVDGKVTTLGPLIHNPGFVKELEKKGIMPEDSIDDVKDGTLIIRTHGVPDSVIEKAKSKGLKVVDLTCPFVKKVHDYARDMYENGYKVIVVGEKKHPEVIGIVGNIDALVVGSPQDAKKIGTFEKIGVVAQTTQSLDNFNNVVAELRNHAKELKVQNTICSETSLRQEHAKELAGEVDVMVVIGGRNSGNTRRLFEICSAIVESYYIERASELDPNWFSGKKIAGVTAGASTPQELVDEVMERIRNEF